MNRYLKVFLLTVLINFNALANDDFKIIAVVDDTAISSLDVDKRVNLAISSSGLENSNQTIMRLYPQIVKTLIDEALYKAEAKKLGIKTTSIDINSAIANLEKQNGIKAGEFETFLNTNNIPIEATKDQIESQVIWGKLISKKIRPTIKITEIELNEKLEHISNSSGISELNVSEIVLSVDNPEDAKRVNSLSLKMAKDIRKGADFASVAQSLSSSSTAAEGGKLGWIREEHVPKEIISKVRNLQVGEISDPFYFDERYYIMRLNDRRALVNQNEGNPKVDIRRSFVPLDANYPQSEAEKILSNMKTHASKYSSCKDFANFAKNIGSHIDPEIITANIDDLNPNIKEEIRNTPVHNLTRPIAGPEGIHIFAVCKRYEAKKSILEKDKVRNIILRRKLDLQARRYLRNLNNKAFIEIRK